MDVDHERLEVHVLPARGYKRPKFGGVPGDVHPKVRQKMRDVLAANSSYAYLDGTAVQLLQEARGAATDANLFDSHVLSLGPQRCALLTWTGSRIQQTLQAAFAVKGIAAPDELIGLAVPLSEDRLSAVLSEALVREPKPEELARLVPMRIRRKYDWLFDDELLDVSISRGALDVDGAGLVLRSIKRTL